MTAPENLRCTICSCEVDSVDKLRILPTAAMQVRFVCGASAKHDRLEGVHGALRAALIDHGYSAERRAPYAEAAARVVTRQLEFTAALAPRFE